MKLYTLTTGYLGVNSYILANEETNEGILIDSGEYYEKIKTFAQEKNVNIKAVLYTHGHFDHMGNGKKFKDDGAKIYISKADASKLCTDENMGSYFHKKIEKFTADYEFIDGETLNICGINVKVLVTPGHTKGSACFVVEDMIFSGDTLFFMDIGRTDFPDGNYTEMMNSLKRLLSLEGDYKVYPGHGESTTLKYEKENNPYRC